MSAYWPVRIEHPVPLIVVAILCSPLLLWLARWYFEDFNSFLEEAGYRKRDDLWWQLMRFGRTHVLFDYKIIGLLGIYGIVVALAYHSLSQFL